MLRRRTGDGGQRGRRPPYSRHNGHTGCGGTHGSPEWEYSDPTATTSRRFTPVHRSDNRDPSASGSSEHLGQTSPIGWRPSTMAAGAPASGSCPTSGCHPIFQVGIETLSPHGQPQFPGCALPHKSGSNDSLINEDLKSEIDKLAATEGPARTLKKIEAILKARSNLAQNAAPLLLVEALMCELR